MAGRIRSLKPELLDLAGAAALSSDAWRVWVSMWVLADDHGNLRAAPRLLAAHVYHDTGKVALVEAALVELGALPTEYRVELFRAGGELFAHLCGWTGGTCSAVEQYLPKPGKSRVPKPDTAGAERVDASSMFTRTSAPSRGKSRKVSESVGESRRLSATFDDSPRVSALAGARADLRSPISDHDPDPDLHAGESDDDMGGGPDRESQTPEAPAVSTPRLLPLPAPAPTEPPSTPRAKRPRYEPQWLRAGVPLLDPATGKQLMLDVAELSPAEVEARRAAALAAMEAAPQSTNRPPPPRSGTVEPPVIPPAPYPGADPEQAVHGLLLAAPPPIRFLAGRSESRLASGLVGGQLRYDDIRAALTIAALKLDPRHIGITPESPDDQLEALHRFVAGFVAQQPVQRRAGTAAYVAPEEGAKLLERYIGQHRARFGKPYEPGEDDQHHAAEIAAELRRRLTTERERDPKLDEKRFAMRLLASLFESWLSDPWAAKCGHSLKQLARLLREEPNRLQLHHASAPKTPAPEHPPSSPRAITTEERQRVEATIAAIGAPG